MAKLALAEKLNVRILDAKTVGISIDETTTVADVDALFKVGDSEERYRHISRGWG